MALKYRVITMSFLLGLGLNVSLIAHADSVEEKKIKFFNDEILKKINTICQNIDIKKRIEFVNKLISNKDVELVEANSTYYIFKGSAILAQNNRERIKNEINKDCKDANDKAFADAEARRQASLSGSTPAASGAGSDSSGSSARGGGGSGSGIKIEDALKIADQLDKVNQANDAKNKPSSPADTTVGSTRGAAANGSAGTNNSAGAGVGAAIPNQTSSGSTRFDWDLVTESPGSSGAGVASKVNIPWKKPEGLDDLSNLSPEDLKSFNELSEQAEKVLAESPAEIKGIPAGADGAAKKVIDPSSADVIDSAAAAKLAADKAAIAAFDGQLEIYIESLHSIYNGGLTAIVPTCTNPLTASLCAASKAVLSQIPPLVLKFQDLKAINSKSQQSCSSSATRSDNFCSIVRSPQAILVQQLFSIGLTALSSTTSAAKTCGVTSSLSKVAQGGMLIAQVTCTGFNLVCDFSCKSAAEKLAELEALNLKVFAVGVKMIALPPLNPFGSQVQVASAGLKTVLATHIAPTGLVPSSVALCQRHKASILTMGTQIAGLALAVKDAKSCKNKLSSGSDSGDDGKKAVTTAEFCAKPENVSSIACKCYLNPKDSACAIQAIANGASKANQEDFSDRPNSFLGGRTGTNSGVSAFAGATNGSGNDSANLNNRKNGNDGSEFSASSNLNNSGAVSALSGSSLLSGADNQADGSIAGVGSSGSSSAVKNKSGEQVKGDAPKSSGFSFSGLSSSLGSFFGSGSAAAKKPVKISESRQKELEQAVKRKIASEQFRSEVTTANGNSNFEKVSNKYRSQQQSFLNEE